jgi:flagellar assembly factor FliW
LTKTKAQQTENIYNFPEGILGFENIKQFRIVEKDESPFVWLQAINKPDLNFVLMDPHEIREDYNLKIPNSDLHFLEADKTTKLICYVIITIPQDPRKMSANFQGPLVFNPANKIGKQCISLHNEYTVRHNVLEEMAKKGGE